MHWNKRKSKVDRVAAAEGDRGAALSPARERGLREAIEDALARGRRSLAERLADAAARLPRTSPSLACAIMRVRLGRNAPAAALAASRAASRVTPSLTLLRALAQLELGQWLEAHLELSHAWARGALCPGGMQLLAHLEDSSGDRARARSLLNELRGAGAGIRALALLLCEAVESGEMERANELGDRLSAGAVFPSMRGEIAAILASLGMPAVVADAQPSDRHVGELAAELALAPGCAETLVEAQKRQVDRPSAELIRSALHLAADRMVDRAAARAAMIELTALLDGVVVASELANEAVAEFPMSTLLRELQSRLERALEESGRSRDRDDRQHIIATIGRDAAPARRRSAA